MPRKQKRCFFPVTYTDVEEITLYAVYTEVGENDVYASLTVHPNNGEEATVMYGVQGQTLSIGNLNDLNPAPLLLRLAAAPKGGI